MPRERGPTRTLCGNAQKLWGKILWFSRLWGRGPCGMAGTNERSSAGACSHQAEWAGGQWEPMVLWKAKSLERAADSYVQSHRRAPQGLSLSLPPWQSKGRRVSSVKRKIDELRKPLQEGATGQGILRRHRAGILAMAPLSLGETHRKDHASHQGTFSFHLLDNQRSGGRQVPPGLFQLGMSPPHQPWQHSTQTPSPTWPLSLPSDFSSKIPPARRTSQTPSPTWPLSLPSDFSSKILPARRTSQTPHQITATLLIPPFSHHMLAAPCSVWRPGRRVFGTTFVPGTWWAFNTRLLKAGKKNTVKYHMRLSCVHCGLSQQHT